MSEMHRFAKTLLILLLSASASDARLVRLRTESQNTPTYAQNYERLAGTFFGELDPSSPLNAIINDISLAPRNQRGRVEYSATFTLLVPRDRGQASGVLWYEVPNRGNSPLNPTPSANALAAGHILLSSGWQGDLTPRPGLETITVPVAKNRDGSAITGPVLARLSNIPANARSASLETGFSGLHYQLPATLDTTSALLTKQAFGEGEMIPIAPGDWAFATCDMKPFPGEADPHRICIKDGFEPDKLYQLTYIAKDPLVLGIGLAATRDLVSFFRYADHDDTGAPNPAAKIVRHSIAFGTSQSGNFIKTFINLGFNEDESHRMVWDGVNPNIAARQNPLNFRFAIPGGAANLYEPGSEGVLWWSRYDDKMRGRAAGSLLERCRATKTCPKTMESFGSSEFWGLRMSPGLVGTSADTDIPVPPDVRRYYFPGVTHGGGRGGFRITSRISGGAGCELPNNSNSTTEMMRALRLALTAWVVDDTAPPESRFPTLAHGDLVPPDHRAMGYPVIPGLPLPDNLINVLPNYDFGSIFTYADLSGAISIQPPRTLGVVPQVVPRTDSDGNETSGIPSVFQQVPLGTYLGWNVTASGYLRGRGCGFAGGFIPFAKTKQERLATGDPRPSLEERYGTHEAFVAHVRDASRHLVEERFLLQEDADRFVREAEASDVLR
jgi:hypothetical protein